MRASIQDEAEMSSCAIGSSENAQIQSRYRQVHILHRLVMLAQENDGAGRTRRRSPLGERISFRRRALAERNIVEMGERGVRYPVVVVVNEREGIGMARNHTSCHLDPMAIIRAGVGQYCGGCRGGVVPQGRGDPVVGHRIVAGDKVPE